MDLEENHGLNTDLPAHLWLLHLLFLDAINDDIARWAEAWNHHKLSLRYEPDRSPRDMYIFGMLQDGHRGIQHLIGRDDEDVDEFYGVDWDVINDPALRHHFHVNNPDDDDNDRPHTNPFETGGLPRHMTEVICEVAYDPPRPQLDIQLWEHLSRDGVDLSSRSMESRYLLWERALQFCLGLNI
jgi:hypothetical protein